MADATEAIRLDRSLAGAIFVRGTARFGTGDLDPADPDYEEALRRLGQA